MASGYGLASLWVIFGIGATLFVLATRREAAARAAVPEVSAAAVAAGDLTLPGEHTFRNEESPGPVVFRHESHVDSDAPSCGECHQADWSLQKPGHPLRGKLVHAEMDKGALCGACHDGKKAFATSDGCETCHEGE